MIVPFYQLVRKIFIDFVIESSQITKNVEITNIEYFIKCRIILLNTDQKSQKL